MILNKAFLFLLLKVLAAGLTAYFAVGLYDGGSMYTAIIASIAGLLGGKSVEYFIPH